MLFAHAQKTISPRLHDDTIWWLADGVCGVYIFFVLSGYLITSILIREYRALGRVDLWAFYCRRILRIMPAFYAYIVVLALMDWADVVRIPGALFAFAVTHLFNYAQAIMLVFHLQVPPRPDDWFVGHFWTLSMEEQFYWIWPVLLIVILRTKFYAGLPALLLAFPLIRLASYYLAPDLRGPIMVMLHSASDPIFAGCLLAICQTQLPQWNQRLLLPAWGVAAVLFYILVVHHCIQHFMPGWYRLLIGFTVLVTAITLLVANLVGPKESFWYHRLLETPALVYLGRISYSVYLWQQLFLTPLNTTIFGKWPLNLIAALVAGWLSYQLIELPFLAVKKKYFSGHEKKSTPASEPATVPAS